MEASQASEAGSIPVARSTPRPVARRAVLLCPLRAYNGDWRRHQHPREPRAHTNGCGTVQRGIARHKGPTRGRHSAQGLRGVPPPLPAWRAPRRLQNLGAVPVSLKYLAQHGPNTGTSTKKLAQHKASGSSVPHSGVTVWWSARLIWVRSPCDPSRKLSTSDSK